MYDDITLTMVVCNEGHRLGGLLKTISPFFAHIIVGVQASDDNTEEIARAYADVVVTDERRGYGDASYGPLVLPQVPTRWSFKVDGDEFPNDDLLDSLGACVDELQRSNLDGAWIRFRSWIDDIEWDAYHSHLRLFRTEIGWPATLHSRPPTDKTIEWKIGWIEHRKTLDEHVRGYLEYLRRSEDNTGWIDHNRSMIWHACNGTAQKKSWDYVKAHEWWPEVQDTIFAGGVPETPEL